MPVHRWEMTGSPEEDSAPPLPDGTELEDIQSAADGAGSLFHRIYRTTIRSSDLTAEELMARIGSDLDAMAPSGMARFQKVRGDKGRLRVGDEYVVRMPGPWDGPVRVIEVTPDSLRLATLDGHLEAGQIEFRAHSNARTIEFVIESWARSGDRVSKSLYEDVRMAKEIQLHMWTSVLQRVTRMADGHMEGGVRVITRCLPGAPPDTGDESSRELRALAELSVNFDPSRSAEYTRENGWHVDDLSATLPNEASGDPVQGGSFMVAKQLMHDYQVADPAKIRADYDPGAPLDGRDMLLEIRFRGLRIHVGVRVSTPYDESRVVDGRRVRVFGWSYRTLEGHFEQGEMHYEVWKWLDDGDVEFRLHSYSRPATSGPLWTRLGFRVIGRHYQLDYYRSACRRMRRLTEAQLELADVRRRDERADHPESQTVH